MGGLIPPEAYAEILALSRTGSPVVLDLSQLGNISGLGLRTLLFLFRFVKATGSEVSSRGVPAELEELAETTGFAQFFRHTAPGSSSLLAWPAIPRIDAYPTHSHGRYALGRGFSLPFGATEVPRGINFSVYSTACVVLHAGAFRAGCASTRGGDPFSPRIPRGRRLCHDGLRPGPRHDRVRIPHGRAVRAQGRAPLRCDQGRCSTPWRGA